MDEKTITVPLNFKVTPAFRREFKTYAAAHDVSMSALIVQAFEALKEREGKRKPK
jgi:hypothetical protein